MTMKAPFPYFGGKSRAAPLVWERFGKLDNYVEPFFGSGAVLFAQPYDPTRTETVNDMDAYLSNFWRALQSEPKAVAQWADWPVNEVDLEARHKWLVEVTRKREFVQRMKNDPDYYDAKMAGWWVWGISQWIGAGWCSGEWHGAGSELNAGRSVHRKLPNLGGGKGLHRRSLDDLGAYFAALADRLRRVRVCCGDWLRICGPSPTYKHGMTGVFLDPPYGADADRTDELYSAEDLTVAAKARDWAIEAGRNPLMRIALCGYEGEHEMPADWECVAWKAGGGYALQHAGGESQGRANKHRERAWFSPACLKPTLFPMQDLQRCDREIAEVKDALLAGHPDVAGLALALRDWSAERGEIGE